MNHLRAARPIPVLPNLGPLAEWPIMLPIRQLHGERANAANGSPAASGRAGGSTTLAKSKTSESGNLCVGNAL